MFNKDKLSRYIVMCFSKCLVQGGPYCFCILWTARMYAKNNKGTNKIVVGIHLVYRDILSKSINFKKSRLLQSKKLNWKFMWFLPQNWTYDFEAVWG